MEQNEKVNTLNTKAEPFIPIVYDKVITPSAPADALLFDDMFAAYEGALSSKKRENLEIKESSISNKITNIDEEKAKSNIVIESKENKKVKIIIPEKKFLKNEEWIAKNNEEYKSDDDFKIGTSSGYGFPAKKWKKKDNLINKEGNDVSNEEIKCGKKEEIEENKEERIGWPEIGDIKPQKKERVEENKRNFEKKSQPSEDSWSNVESSGSEKTEDFQPVNKTGRRDGNFDVSAGAGLKYGKQNIKDWGSDYYETPKMTKTEIPKNKPTPNPKGWISNTTRQPKEESEEITSKPNDEEDIIITTAKSDEEFETPIEKSDTKTVKIVPKPWPTAALNTINSRSQKQTSTFQPSQARTSQRIEIPQSPYNPFSSEISSSQEFDLKTYKTNPCPKGAECKGLCMNYHYIGEKRRDPKSTYFPSLCKNAENCVLGDRCSKAHNLYEILYHPQAYMSLECPFQKDGKDCVMGKQCFFTHRKVNKQEIITIPEYQPKSQPKFNPQNACGDTFHMLDQREKELEDYEQRLKAKCKCNRGIKKYVFVPCGHLICERCRMDRCVVCGGNGKSYMMH